MTIFPRNFRRPGMITLSRINIVRPTAHNLSLLSHLHSGRITEVPTKRRKLAPPSPSSEDELDPPQRRLISPVHRGVKRKVGADDAPLLLLPGFEQNSSRPPRRPPHHQDRSPLSPGRGQRSRQASGEHRNAPQHSRRPPDRQRVPADRAPGYRRQDPGSDEDCPLAPLPQPQVYMHSRSRAPHDAQGDLRAGSRPLPDAQGYMRAGSRVPSDSQGHLRASSHTLPDAHRHVRGPTRVPSERSLAARPRATPDGYGIPDARYAQHTVPLRMDYLQPQRGYREMDPRPDLRVYTPPYQDDRGEYYEEEEDGGYQLRQRDHYYS